MEMIGKRHPFAGKYKVAVQISTNKIVAMEVELSPPQRYALVLLKLPASQ